MHICKSIYKRTKHGEKLFCANTRKGWTLLQRTIEEGLVNAHQLDHSEVGHCVIGVWRVMSTHSECEGDGGSCLSCGRSVEVHLSTERPSFCNMETERQEICCVINIEITVRKRQEMIFQSSTMGNWMTICSTCVVLSCKDIHCHRQQSN